MENAADRQLELVKKLSFVRWGGTPQEEIAARVITDEIEKAGGSFERMPFEIPAYSCIECKLSVTEPYQKEIEVIPHGRTGDIEGEYKFLYLERGDAMDYLGKGDLSDTVVLINALTYDAYKLLCEKKPAAFISISGKYYQTPDDSDLMPRPMRDPYLENGKIPGFVIRASDALEMVANRVTKVRVSLKQTEFNATSHDILAVVKGTEDSEEDIVLTAHYDSVLFGTGSWDNATGSVTLLYLYEHFLKHPAKRTLRFIWCGSEEQGLLGSKAYVEKNPDLVKRIKFCFNFDMCGTILGPNLIFVTGGDELKNYAEQYCREIGWSTDFRVGVHSSDSAPFCDKGIPALGLSRGTKTGEIHTRYDLAVTLSGERLLEMGEFAAGFVTKVANSAVLPVDTGMPDSMKTELDKYFLRDKKKEEEEKK